MPNGGGRSAGVATTWLFIILIGLMAWAAGILTPELVIVLTLVGILTYVAAAIYIIREWERIAVLRLGKFINIRGPGITIVWPIIETVPRKVSLRIVPYMFSAEQTLTRDNIPVSVDAVVYYRVVDPEKAILHVEDYEVATQFASQTSLREVIGMVELDELLAHREKIASHLQEIIDEKTETWGVKVTAVELRDIRIPKELQDAIALQAQAERERRARVTLAQAEVEAAQKMLDAAKTYVENPVAFELRWMNILYEMGRQNNTLMLIPVRFPIAFEPGEEVLELIKEFVKKKKE
ncbi:MAG: slipin family protein [Thermoprotei archaeon]|nr:MAG: slipin family protein [Thermoprotei archaeon]